MRAVPFVFVACLTLCAGCASTGGGQGGGQDRDLNVITRQEILDARASDLWEVVNNLRPWWLQAIDTPSFSGGSEQILVYRDNVRLGGTEALRGLSPEIAQEIQWLDRMEAASRLSRSARSGEVAGAIVVVTRSR